MASLKKMKILIVDDMELNRQILSVILKDNYDILEASNGSEALSVLKREHNNIVLIMLDIIMPVMDGFEFLERVKLNTTFKSIPIIFVTAETYRENILKGIQEGVCDVIAKPFDPYLVCARVKHLIKLTNNRKKNQTNVSALSSSVNMQGQHPEFALIVDDIEVNRALIKTSLERRYKILEAENGKVALELLKAYKGNIAVVLLDIIMPVMDGVEMMTKARQQYLLNQVPVIAITSENSPIKMKRMTDVGICEIIHKPFDPEVVMNRVNNMIELFSGQEDLA